MIDPIGHMAASDSGVTLSGSCVTLSGAPEGRGVEAPTGQCQGKATAPPFRADSVATGGNWFGGPAGPQGSPQSPATMLAAFNAYVQQMFARIASWMQGSPWSLGAPSAPAPSQPRYLEGSGRPL